MGSATKAFVGDYATKGLFAYRNGPDAGVAYFGTGGSVEQMLLPVTDESQYRPDNSLNNADGFFFEVMLDPQSNKLSFATVRFRKESDRSPMRRQWPVIDLC